MIDMHCHLDLYKNPQELLEKIKIQNLYILSVTTTPSAFLETKRLSKDFPRVKTGLGLHPELAHERASELSLFDRLLTETEYVGEIGLDGSQQYKKHSKIQLTVFKHILESTAKSGGKVLSIHSRGAAEQVIDCLKDRMDVGIPIFHWFSGNQLQLKRAIELGAWFSVGPAMISNAKGKEIVKNIPTNRLLPESDGPFAKLNGNPITPMDCHLINPFLQEIWSISENEVENQILQNFRDLVSAKNAL